MTSWLGEILAGCRGCSETHLQPFYFFLSHVISSLGPLSACSWKPSGIDAGDLAVENPVSSPVSIRTPMHTLLTCHMPLLQNGSDLVWLASVSWLEEEPLSIRSLHTHHSKPLYQAPHIDLSDFCVLLKLLEKSRNHSNVQRRKRQAERTAECSLCLNPIVLSLVDCWAYSRLLQMYPMRSLPPETPPKALWSKSPSTPPKHLLSQGWSSEAISLKLTSLFSPSIRSQSSVGGRSEFVPLFLLLQTFPEVLLFSFMR